MVEARVGVSRMEERNDMCKHKKWERVLGQFATEEEC
uniref:Uncharacterized protein n=1 Tax=Peronospora matthiolae TaxID=2874970 RepID=A0AAV1TDT9_9STRA